MLHNPFIGLLAMGLIALTGAAPAPVPTLPDSAYDPQPDIIPLGEDPPLGPIVGCLQGDSRCDGNLYQICFFGMWGTWNNCSTRIVQVPGTQAIVCSTYPEIGLGCVDVKPFGYVKHEDSYGTWYGPRDATAPLWRTNWTDATSPTVTPEPSPTFLSSLANTRYAGVGVAAYNTAPSATPTPDFVKVLTPAEQLSQNLWRQLFADTDYAIDGLGPTYITKRNTPLPDGFSEESKFTAAHGAFLASIEGLVSDSSASTEPITSYLEALHYQKAAEIRELHLPKDDNQNLAVAFTKRDGCQNAEFNTETGTLTCIGNWTDYQAYIAYKAALILIGQKIMELVNHTLEKEAHLRNATTAIEILGAAFNASKAEVTSPRTADDSPLGYQLVAPAGRSPIVKRLAEALGSFEDMYIIWALAKGYEPTDTAGMPDFMSQVKPGTMSMVKELSTTIAPNPKRNTANVTDLLADWDAVLDALARVKAANFTAYPNFGVSDALPELANQLKADLVSVGISPPGSMSVSAPHARCSDNLPDLLGQALIDGEVHIDAQALIEDIYAHRSRHLHKKRTGSTVYDALAAPGLTQHAQDIRPFHNTKHMVIYAEDAFDNGMPPVADLGNFTRFVLGYYRTFNDNGAKTLGVSKTWRRMNDTDRKALKQSYNDAGIAVMLGAFGPGDAPTTYNKDPYQLARDIAQWVMYHDYDGVDIDYQDNQAVNAGKSRAWLSAFTKTLRQQLGWNYLVSHSPQANWFNDNVYSFGSAESQQTSYGQVHKDVGGLIDFYNVKYWNHGVNVYTNASTLIWGEETETMGAVPHYTFAYSTAVRELNEIHGIPFNKIVVGKPLNVSEAVNGGYMTIEALQDIVAMTTSDVPTGGLQWWPQFMFWKWGDVDCPASTLDLIFTYVYYP